MSIENNPLVKQSPHKYGAVSFNELLLENDHAELDPRFCGRSEFGGLDWALKYGCE